MDLMGLKSLQLSLILYPIKFSEHISRNVLGEL
jgi:hypothetical protein